MLIRSVEKFLRQHEMAATKFGRLAAHDPRLFRHETGLLAALRTGTGPVRFAQRQDRNKMSLCLHSLMDRQGIPTEMILCLHRYKQ